jgi:hypothetical protein
VLTVLLTTSPWFGLALPFLGYGYVHVQRFFTAGSREIQQLESISRSPMYSWFSETLAGRVTIRAYGDSARFVARYTELIDDNNRCSWSNEQAFNYLGLACSGLGTFFMFGAALMAVRGLGSPGLAGLAIRYSMTVRPSPAQPGPACGSGCVAPRLLSEVC